MQGGKNRLSIYSARNLLLRLAHDLDVLSHPLGTACDLIELAAGVARQRQAFVARRSGKRIMYVIRNIADLDHSAHPRSLPPYGCELHP